MNLPEETGVYLFYDEHDELLYVGKAKNIRKRVAQHKRDSNKWKKRIARVDFVLSENEEEALLSEQNLVKRLKPKYNVRLRDDKSYPYIAISWDEEYPRIFLTREKRKRGRKYFGPYLNGREARKIIQTLPKIFPFRSCQGVTPGREKNPCLDWHLGLCGAPCVDYINQKEYRENIKALEEILSGNGGKVKEKLTQEMKSKSQAKEFEQAALLRDRLESLENIRAVRAQENDLDALIFLPDAVFVSRLRSGLPAESSWVPLRTIKGAEMSEKALAFLFQYYDNAPGEVLLEEEVYQALGEARKVFERRFKTQVRSPKRGQKSRFLEKSKKTALLKEANQGKRRSEPLDFLAEWTGGPVERIETYDVSNFGKDHTYVSLVVFENGQKKPADYRLFAIKDRKKPDDYEALREALLRRKKAYQRERRLKDEGQKYDASFASKPDIMLIDGGLGQLHAAQKALDGFLDPSALFSLAKKEETAFSCDGALSWTAESAQVLLFREMRDEAHRFALKNSRLALNKSMQKSPLDEISGVGKKRKQALEKHLPDVTQASIQELEAVPGIPAKLAQAIYHHFHRR